MRRSIRLRPRSLEVKYLIFPLQPRLVTKVYDRFTFRLKIVFDAGICIWNENRIESVN